jgi:hypothetical protein
MSLEVYLAKPFEHRHETEAFEALSNILKGQFGTLAGRHMLLGNVMCAGHDMDAILFKPDGIAIIEMKDHGGTVAFSENGPWKADGREVKGGSKPNPFVQVRGYRIGLRSWLEEQDRMLELHPRSREVWQDISAVVVFSRNIQFDDRVLFGPLRYWFHITDLNHCAERLAKVQSRSLVFHPDEFDSILRQLGIRSDHCLEDPAQHQEAPADLSSAVATTTSTLRLNYLKEFHFRDEELRMRNAGGARFQGAQNVRRMFDEVRRGLNPFQSAPKRLDSRVRGATVYQVNPACELILIELGTFGIPAFLGEPHEVDGWLEAHRDLTVAVDEVSGRVSITRVSLVPHPDHMQAPAVTAENTPYLHRITGIEYEEAVPQALAREHLLSLDETSTESDIQQALELVFNEDLRVFLFDVLSLIRAGNIAGAEARIRLRNGEALPAEDAGPFAQQAAASSVNSDQILVINEISQEQLDRLLAPEHFEDWMLFLHPDQQALVDATFDRPVVLKGVSGSGKTCILVHRARRLAQKYPGQRIGIVTLSRPLSGLLQNLVNMLCTAEERETIFVLPFYQHFSACLKHLGLDRFCDQLTALLPAEAAMQDTIQRVLERWPASMVWDCDPINRAHVDDEWEEFYMQNNPDVCEWLQAVIRPLESLRIDASRYLQEEFTLVRSSFAIPSRQRQYMEMDRVGRTIPFRDSLRRDILQLVTFWEDWLLHGGMIDALGLTLALLPLHQEMQQLPDNLRFRCLLVDEFQDLSSLDLQVLRRLVPIGDSDSLFVAGDTVQKVLVKRLSLGGGVGLDRGPAVHKSITKNYRNSRQILRAAARLANHYGQIARSQGEEMEILDPELAQRETSPPIAIKTNRQIEKAWEIVSEFVGNSNSERWNFCIATTAPNHISIDDIITARPAGMDARPLSGDGIKHRESVTVSSIADLKGFEFRVVLIVGCESGRFPDTGVPPDEVWRDALRLYVAMTRGRDQVYLIYEGEPSDFITVMGDTIVSREEPLPVGNSHPVSDSPMAARQSEGVEAQPLGETNAVKEHSSRTPLPIDPDQPCESHFTPAELEILRRYYAQNVHRENLTFHEWCRPRGLATISESKLLTVRKVPGAASQALARKLRAMNLPATEFGEPKRKQNGQCSAEGCSSRAIPGEFFCYDHKAE